MYESSEFMVMETYTTLSLGSFSDLDRSDGGNTKTEKASDLEGVTFGSAAAPLFDQRVDVTFDDADNSGTIEEDQGATEGVSYAGSLPGTTLDSTQTYDITVTYKDGTTDTTTVTIVQDSNGELFLIGDGNVVLEAKAVESITVDSLIENDFPGLDVPRPDTDFLCFASGTLIETPAGTVAVEDLAAGDLVLTRDNGRANA